MRFLSCLILGGLLFAGCTKAPPPSVPPLHTWMVDDKTFHEQSSRWIVQDSLNVIYFEDNNSNELILSFTQKPTGSKKYKIVYQPQNDNEVSVEQWQNGQGHAGSQDGINKFLTVTEANNGLNFTSLSIPLQEYTWVVDYDVSCTFNVSE